MGVNPNEDRKLSVSVPTGVVAGVAVLTALAIAYAFIDRGDGDDSPVTSAKSKMGKGMRRKVGLTTLIAMLENDLTRKVVIAALKAMAKRS